MREGRRAYNSRTWHTTGRIIRAVRSRGLATAASDPDLAMVVRAWPALPEGPRRQILALIREAAKRHG